MRSLVVMAYALLLAAPAYAADASGTATAGTSGPNAMASNTIKCSDWHLNKGEETWSSNSDMRMTTVNGESMSLHNSVIAPHVIKIGKPPVDLWAALTQACGGGTQ